MDYKGAGVDIEVADQLVDWLKKTADPRAPHADRLVSGIGGFAAIFRLPSMGYRKPCLVSSTDGVGTKIKLAAHFETYESVGQDLVAMCVNDLVCSGAQPLFFLDYFATSRLELPAAKSFLHGVRQACTASGCALIGGETAEMPGVYGGRDFDAAGFAVGVVDEEEILGGHRVKVGDHVLGVSSSGFHSNGYSLLRKVFAGDLQNWRDVLMTPTHLYAGLVTNLASQKKLKAVAHITGGGTENIPRVMPQGTRLLLVDWPWPDPFVVVQERAGLAREEMLKTLNCGIGLVLIVDPSMVNGTEETVRDFGFSVYQLGKIEAADTSDLEPEIVY